MGYSIRLAARVLLYASSYRHDNTYHGICYTSRGALAGTNNGGGGGRKGDRLHWNVQVSTSGGRQQVKGTDSNPEDVFEGSTNRRQVFDLSFLPLTTNKQTTNYLKLNANKELEIVSYRGTYAIPNHMSDASMTIINMC